MNGKDMVAVMMALNKQEGEHFDAKDEEVGNIQNCDSVDEITFSKKQI